MSYLQDFFNWLIGVVHQMGLDIINSVILNASSFFPALSWGVVQTYIDQLDDVFPVYETVTYLTSYIALWGLCFLYRLIKSWIPTENG